MLWSLALVFLGGLLAGEVFRRLRLPPLLGMLLVGIAFGPYALGLLDDSLLAISADLRKIALIIILTRAGLSLDIGDLRKVGRSAVLLCFVPATFEIVGTVILAPRLLGVSVLEAAIIGSVIAAVSPAVVVPRMLRLMDEGYGTKQGIPQMILAGASVDDVYVIVLFSSFTSLASGGTLSPLDFVRIPTSLVLGIAA
ncbi:MAG: cation:proton antiporter, partial [Butyricicoccus pullicaecorum]|nr:cation:proton antiporter [Butyricicoccus pullicaecorum]